MLTTLIAGLIGLNIVIFIHELGHFMAALYTGVYVEKFSLGFGGPKLFSKKIGNTVYQATLVLFGGFVKLKGEDLEDDDKNDPDSLTSKPPLQRMLVFVAGTAMNLVLGVVIFIMINWIGNPTTAHLAKVGRLIPDMPAEKGGLMVGDLITKIDDKNIKDWLELHETITRSDGHLMKFTIKRNGGYETFDIQPEKKETDNRFYIGIYPFQEPVIGKVIEGQPADFLGLKPDDRILEVNGNPVDQWDDFQTAIFLSPDKKIDIKWKRNNSVMDGEVLPVKQEYPNAKGETFVVDGNVLAKPGDKFFYFGKIGAVPKTYKIKYGFLEGIWRGLQESYYVIADMLVVIKKLFTLQISMKFASGPVGIFSYLGESAKISLASFLRLVALISLNLAIINLLPIPVFDGGFILFTLIEVVKGKPLPARFLEYIHRVSVVFIILLAVWITYNDILREVRFSKQLKRSKTQTHSNP